MTSACEFSRYSVTTAAIRRLGGSPAKHARHVARTNTSDADRIGHHVAMRNRLMESRSPVQKRGRSTGWRPTENRVSSRLFGWPTRPHHGKESRKRNGAGHDDEREAESSIQRTRIAGETDDTTDEEPLTIGKARMSLRFESRDGWFKGRVIESRKLLAWSSIKHSSPEEWMLQARAMAVTNTREYLDESSVSEDRAAQDVDHLMNVEKLMSA